MARTDDGPIDIVYTWVDDRFPGFQEERRRYAANPHDLAPNRTRDNLDLMKFGLRSLERFAPWRGTVYIIAPRPQAPSWLRTDHPGVRVVHLDEIMPATLLPCFNAFAIETYVHTIPSLSHRYLHFNDDMLLAGPLRRDVLMAPDGRLNYYFTGWLPSSANTISEKAPPFQAGRINTSRALTRALGPGRYPQQAHHPRIIDRSDMERLIARFPQEVAATRRARFRGHDTILPHMLLAAWLVTSGEANFHGREACNRLMWYVGLEDYALWNRLALWWAMRHRPVFLAMNDNFGTVPNAAAENVARRFLHRLFPEPSSYERA
jgi:hypothetical protein